MAILLCYLISEVRRGRWSSISGSVRQMCRCRVSYRLRTEILISKKKFLVFFCRRRDAKGGEALYYEGETNSIEARKLTVFLLPHRPIPDEQMGGMTERAVAIGTIESCKCDRFPKVYKPTRPLHSIRNSWLHPLQSHTYLFFSQNRNPATQSAHVRVWQYCRTQRHQNTYVSLHLSFFLSDRVSKCKSGV